METTRKLERNTGQTVEGKEDSLTEGVKSKALKGISMRGLHCMEILFFSPMPLLLAIAQDSCGHIPARTSQK